MCVCITDNITTYSMKSTAGQRPRVSSVGATRGVLSHESESVLDDAKKVTTHEPDFLCSTFDTWIIVLYSV